MNLTIFAYLYGFATLIAVLFQLALAAGIPWGHLAMGGRFPGKFPPNMRVGAVVQAGILTFLACIVLSRAGVAFPGLTTLSNTLIWVVVGISGISLVLNLITPSKWERRLWAPVGLVMVVCSLVVALSA
ncbi:MAG: hypothetical protein HC806_07430 [Anaerolineae bacterium]|nr:hypothetical protein [Anaerolineae bacterium]